MTEVGGARVRRERGRWAVVSWLGRAVLLAAVVLPAFALLTTLGTHTDPTVTDETGLVTMRPYSALLGATLGYSTAAAVVAAALGWLPGRWIAGARTARGRAGRVALIAAPVCLPPSAVFYAWWQLWPADSPLHAWAVAAQAVPLLQRLTLVVALATWGWPIVAWCVAGASRRLRRGAVEAAALDGAGWWRRQRLQARAEWPGAALGALVVALIVAGHTTAFDLANVFALANEMRALDAEGAPPSTLIGLGAVPVVLAAVGAMAVGAALRMAAPRRAGEAPEGRCDRFAWLGIAVAMAAVVGPLVVLAVRVAERPDVGQYLSVYGSSLGRSLGVAALSGLLAGVVALGALDAALGGGRRRLSPAAWIWLAAALAPATLVALGLEAAYNRTGLGWVYGSTLIVVLGHLARFGFVPALLGARVVYGEGDDESDLRAIDGARTLRAVIATRAPRVLAAVLASFVLVLALGLGEMPVTARVHPPASDPIVVRLLNDMHYQRPQMVIMSLAVLVAGSACAGVTLGLLALTARRGRSIPVVARPLVVLAAVAIGLGGCAKPAAPDPAPGESTFGGTGTALGRFTYPRALAVDVDRGAVYVVDKTARVQRYDESGTPVAQWRMPEWELGKPTGISVAPDGRVVVADTHYHRVMVFDPDGRELNRFGQYGEAPGDFIYPTDIAFGPDGRWYVSEYGGNDRIQVFDATGSFLFAFGHVGSDRTGFERPQAMDFAPDGSELFIADACNHRIVVATPEGEVVRTFGSSGHEPGQLLYPYGLHVRPDGTLLVCEFGNHRVQHLTADGESLGLYGSFGTAPGRLRYPWSVDETPRTIFVLDSRNDRVTMLSRPWHWSPTRPEG